MIVGATFGSRGGGSGGAGGESSPGAWEKIYDETKEGDNVNYSTVTLQPGCMYLYARSAWVISTGKYYGAYMALVTVPSDNDYAATAPTRAEICNIGTSGISLTWGTSGVVTWRSSSTAYRGRVVFYKLT